jgi:transcription initiation factor TFIIH subunit 1
LAVAENAGDPLLDLRTFEDNTLEEGFGGSAADKSVVNSGNIVHQNMIKRFNQHSFMVLKTCTDVKTLNSSPEKIKATAIATTAANNNNSIKNNNHQEAITDTTTNGGATDAVAAAAAIPPVKEKKLSKQALDDISTAASRSIEPERKRKRIMEKLAYTDLGDDLEEVGGKKRQAPPLNLTKVERYLHGPMPAASATNSLGDLLDDEPQQQSLMDLDAVTAQIYQETHNWHQRTPHKVLVSATAAVNALGELSPGGFLMRGYQEQSLARE